MTAEDALRYLDYRASECREHDMHEALCLLTPALLKALALSPMNDWEAKRVRTELRNFLNNEQTSLQKTTD